MALHPRCESEGEGGGCSPLYLNEDTKYESDTDKSDTDKSDGMTSHIEGKRVFSDFNLRQTVATCVVSSFTEKSLHPDKE